MCCSIPAYPSHCKKFIQSLCFSVISITIATIINFAFGCILLAWVNRNVYCGSCNVYPQQNRVPLASLRPRPNSLIKVLELFNFISFQGCSLYNVFSYFGFAQSKIKVRSLLCKRVQNQGHLSPLNLHKLSHQKIIQDPWKHTHRPPGEGTIIFISKWWLTLFYFTGYHLLDNLS